ncbi:MAG: hypothetical protein ACI4F7_03805 [Acutalibacteraceae bacterium]
MLFEQISIKALIKCTQMGGRAGIPDSETIDKFLRTGEINYEKINRRKEHYKRVFERRKIYA